jgi:serine/threonine protein kinase
MLHEQIEREFAALAHLDQLNIVAVRELYHDNGVPFFTMECVHGTSFDVWIKPEGHLDLARLRFGMRQIARAMQSLHTAGMIHCDLKPANVLVTPDHRAVLLDFGLVTNASESSGHGPPQAEVYGTPAYMAPEQAAGSKPTRASDRYALGVMLYEALTGRLPFAGNLSAILWARQCELPRPPRAWTDEVPEDLEALCLELMAIDPSQRPSDEDVMERLS